MKNLKMLLALVALLPAIASAQTIDHRRHEQRGRIEQGVRHGSLTRAEAARLRAQEMRIRLQESRARHSGHHLSRAERARIERELNHASRSIHQQKHDEQHRRP